MAENGKKPLNLAGKLAAIQASVGRVDKRGENTAQHYKYAQAEDIYREVREKMAEQKVVLIPSVKSITYREIKRADKETGQALTPIPVTKVKLRLTWLDSESDERFEVDWDGEGADVGDKGLNKAYTAALKYFLIGSFLIPTGDDPEADTDTDKATTPRRSNSSSKGDCVSEGQAKFAHVLRKKAGLDDESFGLLLKTRFEIESAKVEDLPWKRFDNLKTFLESPEARLPVKTGETDVPADMEGLNDKPPPKGDEDIPF